MPSHSWSVFAGGDRRYLPAERPVVLPILNDGRGEAAALAILLIWVYYSSMIFFLGAEFTQIRMQRRSGGVQPVKRAATVDGASGAPR